MRKTRTMAAAAILAAALCLTGCGGSNNMSSSGAYYEPAMSSEAKEAGYAAQESAAGAYDYDSVEMEEARESYEDAADTADSGADNSALRAQDGQKIVYTASLSIQSLEYDQSAASIRRKIREAGGFSEAESEYDKDYNWYRYTGPSSGNTRSLSITARIPSDKFEAFLNSLDGDGKIMSKSVNAQNISQVYANKETYKKALEKEQERLLAMMDRTGTVIYYLALYPQMILQGQIWRLVTFVFIPASSGFMTLLFLYFYYFIGSTMEQEWGQAKFNLYFFTGMLFTVIYAFAVYFISGVNPNPYSVAEFIYLSMFFSFATYYPDMQVLLFFFLPVKVKWLAWVDAAFFVYEIIRLLFAGYPLLALMPVVAILNYLLFFATDIGDTLAYWKRRAGGGSGPKVINFNKAKTKTKPGAKEAFLHKCAVCGRTDVSDPDMEFRYCSRCNGYYCYCADHINSHIHIQ